MHASSHRLATKLAERLDRVVPAPLRVRASSSSVLLDLRGVGIGGSGCAELLEERDGRTFQELISNAALCVLNDVQDSVIVFLQSKWPIDDKKELALPGARSDQNRIHLWYGNSEENPVIDMEPIEFDQILNRDKSF
jgi:hypothetical protein